MFGDVFEFFDSKSQFGASELLRLLLVIEVLPEDMPSPDQWDKLLQRQMVIPIARTCDA